jgi:membrane associated rhomboid family serine protease
MIPLRDDNLSRTAPVVTVGLLAAVALVFIWQLSLGPAGAQAAVYAFGLIPGALFGEHRLPEERAVVPSAATILTSMFMHGGWLHLIGNRLHFALVALFKRPGVPLFNPLRAFAR